jgi:hypothetical protein
LTNEKNKSLSLLLQRCSRRITLWYYLHCNDVAAFNISTTNATIVGGRIHPNRFDLMEVSTFHTPIATPTVVDRDLFFRQGGDQLNGGSRGMFDYQPVETPVSCHYCHYCHYFHYFHIFIIFIIFTFDTIFIIFTFDTFDRMRESNHSVLFFAAALCTIAPPAGHSTAQ